MIYQEERPRTLDYMLGQANVVENIRSQSIADKWFNVYILEGQYGAGKTSLAIIIALAANCEHKDERGNPCLKCRHCQSILAGNLDYREIDGANNSSVEDIRNLKEYIEFLPTELKVKIVIIDEVHMLSKSAFNAMLKMLEEPPSYVTFILCTTDLEAIPMTVRSRSAGYRFNRLAESDIVNGLLRAAPKYDIELDTAGAKMLASYSDGSMRNAYVLLEQVSVAGRKIDEEACMKVLGIVNETVLFEIIRTIMERDLSEFIQQLDEMEQSGKSFSLVANDLLQACADLVIAKNCGYSRVGGTSFYKESIQNLADAYSLADFCSLAVALRDIRQRTQRGSKYEFIVYMIVIFNEMNQIGLQEKVHSLEMQVQSLAASVEAAPVLVQNVEVRSNRDNRALENAQAADEETVMDIDKKYPIPGEESEAPWGHGEAEENSTYTQADSFDIFSNMDSLFADMNRECMKPFVITTPENKDAADSKNCRDTAEEKKVEMEKPAEAPPAPYSSLEAETPQKESQAATSDSTFQKAAKEMPPEEGVDRERIKATLEEAMSREPILASRYNVSCSIEDTDEGVKVVATERGLYVQLLSFIAQNSITGVSVEFGAD